MRLDDFLSENWKDNKGLQRQFVDGLLTGEGHDRNRGDSCLHKISKICDANTTSSVPAINADIPRDQNSEDDIQTSKSDDEAVAEPVEEWKKPSPQIRKRKQGKYLSPTSKKFKFDPIIPNKINILPRDTAKAKTLQDLNCSSKEFKFFEKQTRLEVARRVYGFDNIKKKIQQMWNKLDIQEKQKYSISNHDEDVNPTHPSETTTLSVADSERPHCVCRQRREIQDTTITCILFQEWFHCNCVNFCTNLAGERNTNYVCASCLDFHFAQFLRYLFYVADITVFDNKERI